MPLSQTDTAQRKAQLRRELLNRRSSLDVSYRQGASQKICESALELIEDIAPSAVLLYCPVRCEADVLPLFDMLMAKKIPVYFPVSKKEDVSLEFRLVRNMDELSLGAYGIREPVDTCPAIRDFSGALCVLPALSADKFGTRLGYGMGYYDRFLAKHRIRTLCPMFEKMLEMDIPCEAADFPLDIIVTEKEVIFTRG